MGRADRGGLSLSEVTRFLAIRYRDGRFHHRNGQAQERPCRAKGCTGVAELVTAPGVRVGLPRPREIVYRFSLRGGYKVLGDLPIFRVGRLVCLLLSGLSAILQADSALHGDLTQGRSRTHEPDPNLSLDTLGRKPSAARYFAMDTELYGVAINVAATLYVAVSAYNRRLEWWSVAWIVPTLLFGVLVIPFFRAFRPLKKDEVRRGGKVFLVLRDYARIIILLMVGLVLTVCTITQNPDLISQNSASLTEAEQTGAFLGSWLGMICYIPIGFVVWLIPRMFKSDAVVEGPTGPLAVDEE